MKKPVEGTYEQMGRCLLAKSEKTLALDLKEVFSIMAEQVGYSAAAFLSQTKPSIVGWISPDPIYMENLHIYHVYEDEGHIENL